jgi:NAD(P)H-dependent FMN reductase
MRILGVPGSLQRKSGNLVLLQTAVARAPEGVEVVLYDGMGELPLFNPDIEEETGVPAGVLRWRTAVAGSSALLIASPEYGFSLTGVLKNAIDWLIGSGELEGKVVAITCAVNHTERGRRGLEALQGTLSAVSARIVGGSPTVRGPGFDADVEALVRAIVSEVNRAG